MTSIKPGIQLPATLQGAGVFGGEGEFLLQHGKLFAGERVREAEGYGLPQRGFIAVGHVTARAPTGWVIAPWTDGHGWRTIPTMQIQINTDHHIAGSEALSAHVTSVVESALSLFRECITRVEVHLTDENGPKDGTRDMRCAMEARLEHHQPIAITHEAATLHQAIDEAADKLARLVENILGRQREEREQRTDPPPAGTPDAPTFP